MSERASTKGRERKVSAPLARVVSTLYPNGGYAPPGDVRVIDNTPGGHPADGMTATVSMGDGAYSSIINPLSFEDGGPEWVMRYGDPESARYSVASLLESYDYLLSDHLTVREATRRLRLLRAARTALVVSGQNLADATNNPPSDPGTEQREAGV